MSSRARFSRLQYLRRHASGRLFGGNMRVQVERPRRYTECSMPAGSQSVQKWMHDIHRIRLDDGRRLRDQRQLIHVVNDVRFSRLADSLRQTRGATPVRVADDATPGP